jgi:putative hydrolase
VAIEIDGDPRRQDIDYMLARDAVAAGCFIALDSDAHAPDELMFADVAIAHARLAGIPLSRIVNCWPTEHLLEWMRLRSTTSAP